MNAVPFLYRLLLLALLPCIAVILYLGGQQYDPALIDFKSAAEILVAGQIEQAPGSAGLVTASDSGKTQTLPGPDSGNIAGFLQIGRERHYTKDNLYEHVDGHAEYFIGAGFIGLSILEYAPAPSKDTKSEIQVEVYDMGNSIQAFGVLTDESGDNAQAISVGTMAFKTSGGISFIKGRYYTKISSFNPKSPLLIFARGFSPTLPAARDSFEIFSRLPDLGKVEKTRFIKEGYRGLDFLRNVVEREYSTGGKKVTVALMTGNVQAIRTLQSSFFEYFKKSGMIIEKAEKDGHEFYKIRDKYEGNWFLIPSSDALFGVFGTEDESIVSSFRKNKK